MENALPVRVRRTLDSILPRPDVEVAPLCPRDAGRRGRVYFHVGLCRRARGRLAAPQLGAVLGREFSYALLRAVTPLEEPTLQQSLAQLVEAELLYQRGHPPQATYLFKHALVQDAAYQSLLRSTRQQYHHRIAQVLEAQFPDVVTTQPELLAHHYTEAGLGAQAISYWLRAGKGAIERSANVEAISHLTRGLELLKALPDTPSRAQQELALRIALGTQLIATKGFAAPEVEATYTRAWALCQQAGEIPQYFPVLRGLWGFYQMRAKLQKARELGEQFLHLAHRGPDSAPLLEAYRELGTTLYWLGEFAAAKEHLERGLALYDAQYHRALAFLYGVDPRVSSLSIVAWVLWFQGYPGQAQQRVHETLTHAQEVSHPFSLAFALNTAAVLHQLRREVPLTHERAEAVMALSATQGFLFTGAWGTIWRGWALAQQGQAVEGIVQITQGLTTYRDTGAELVRPYHLALLADTYRKTAQLEAGLAVLAEAIALVQRTGERWYEAELYRLRGELTLQREVQGRKSAMPSSSPRCSVSSGTGQEIEKDFQQAMEMARRQGAKLLELRAAMSLARLWQRQGKRAEAHALLAPIYGWFTEGFDTADLQEAKALLAALA